MKTEEHKDNNEESNKIFINKQYDEAETALDDSVDEPVFEEPLEIREKGDNDASLWYWIIGALLCVAILWYGFSAGWFGKNKNTIAPVDQFAIPVEPNGGIGNGAESLNAAPIDTIVIESSGSFPVEETLIVTGNLPDGCTYLNEPTQIRDGNQFYITLDTRREGDVCTEALVPYEKRIPLYVNNLPAGTYSVDVNGRGMLFELSSDNTLDLSAGSDK